MREMIVGVRAFHEGKPAIYLLADVRQGTGFSAETRKAVSDDPSLTPYAATVFFGASFAMKTIANMMMRAMALLGRAASGEMMFLDSEEAGRAWLADHRARAEAARKST
ncbi:STAS/SEC14 domain-containing protein [Myxococcaceae bacterium JPH2]|nr:STAS/SEC14 domain-containing protein [Myxococcaceae bacterium JPH2]